MLGKPKLSSSSYLEFKVFLASISQTLQSVNVTGLLAEGGSSLLERFAVRSVKLFPNKKQKTNRYSFLLLLLFSLNELEVGSQRTKKILTMAIGNQDITNSFNGRLVSFAAAFTSVLKRPWQDLQHVGQIE